MKDILNAAKGLLARIKSISARAGGTLIGRQVKEKTSRYWEETAARVRREGGAPEDVSQSPGVLCYENRYMGKYCSIEPITGDPDDFHVDWFFRQFVGKKVKKILSICCGTGFFERHIAGKDYAEEIDAFDASPASVEWARDIAAQRGFDGKINYRVADANTIELEEGKYDVVISMAALHHIENLEHVFQEVKKTLKPGGIFLYDEYVGPKRMQWSDEVLDIVESLLAIFPKRYKISGLTGKIKEKEERPPLKEFIERDPTEAIRSDEIIPLSKQYFEILSLREYGGAILMPLFMHIIGNFDAAREEDRLIMDFCIYLEKLLIRTGQIPANAAFVVCRKQGE